MAINADKTHLWKTNVAQSIDFYNDWFLRFAHGTYRKQRVIRTNDPLIINIALEKKQRTALKRWLLRHGYKEIASDEARSFDAVPPGTFTFYSIRFPNKKTSAKNPIDCIVKPSHPTMRDQIIVIEAKATGNPVGANRWRKKEADKFALLKEHHGKNVKFILLLCGYFDPGYLGYEAAEGIDWVWEHRLNDLSALLVGGKKAR